MYFRARYSGLLETNSSSSP